MTLCDDIRGRIPLYVDHELSGAAALELEAHLSDCPACRLAYDNLRAVVDAVRVAGPLYEVPPESLAAARRQISAAENRQRLRRWLPVAIAAALILCAFAIPLSRRTTVAPSSYASFAAEAHLLYARGAFPLDIHSSEPQAVSDWLVKRLPFQMTVPNYPSEMVGRKRYSLAGARLMQFLDDGVAYLAYEMDGKPISLLIASSTRVTPSGGDTYHSGGLTFHFSAEKGLRMITWSDKGLTYALVSTLDVRGAESCVICHGAASDRPKFENLRPSHKQPVRTF